MAPEEHFDLEELVRAGDQPRALRPEFRERLEAELHAQIASDKDAAPRALSPGTAERLADALSGSPADEASSEQDDDPMVGLLVGVDGPRPLPESLSDRLAGQLAGAESPPWRRVFQRPSVMRVAGGIAAAALISAGISAALLSGGSGSGPGTVASRSNGAAHPTAQAPVRSGSASGLGASRIVPGSAPSVPQGAASSSASAGVAPAAAGAPVVNPTGSSSAPAIYSVTPASGPAGGGTWVTITGIHFTGTTSILFGDTKAPQFTVLSDQEVKAVSPAHLPGAVDIEVVTARGSSPPSPADTYQYTT